MLRSPSLALALVLVVLAIAARASVFAQDPGAQPFGEKIVRLLSSEVRDADRRLAELEDALEGLPELYRGPRGSRYGFHSEPILDQLEPHHIQVDLGEVREIDAIVVIPVHLPTLTARAESYGFPLRFKIQVAETPQIKKSPVVVDRTAEDFDNPGRYPLLFPTPGAKGRYVRFTSTKHVRSDQDFIWALEELMVLSGKSNLAVGRPHSASSHEELFPNWSIHRVTDGISRLGYPRELEVSPTDGFLSAPSPSPTEEKWIIIDLEKPMPVDEIRFVPTDSDDPEVVGGRGYPRMIVADLSNDPGFGNILWSKGSGKNTLGYPWQSAVALPTNGITARFVRVRSTELFARGKRHSFSLAEVQVYSNGENVALHKAVRVSDATGRENAARWAPEFVVDGFSSTHRLAEWPPYVEKIVERGSLEAEHRALRLHRAKKIETVSAGVTAGVGALGGVAVFGWIWMAVRHRRVRRSDATLLREQIARDLHDDIGSNLAGIVLISEAGGTNPDAGHELREDFQEIRQTAEQTSESMRDIVWLIQVGTGSLRDMFIKMRQTVERILGDLETSIETTPPDFKNRHLNLLLRRHFFFAFKESLNNIRKHAQAKNVAISFVIASNALTFIVADDGIGFDLDSVGDSGHGLNNLKRRASRVNGECLIESSPGSGTSITFSAPLNKRNR